MRAYTIRWTPARVAGVVFFVLWGLITHGTYAGTGDEPHYQIIAHSLAFDRDLDLTTDYADSNNLALGGHFEGGPHVIPGKDGRLRPVHDIGLPVLFTPYYFVAYKATELITALVPAAWLARSRLNFTVVLRHLLSFAMMGLTAAIAVWLFRLFTAMSPDSGRAPLWALLMVLTPPLLSHSFLFFTEILSAFIALAVFLWLRGTSTDRVAGLLAGAGTGYLMLVHARNVGLVAGLVLIAALQWRRSRRHGVLIPFLIGAAVLFAVRTAVTHHLWGTWLLTPHARFGIVEPGETLVVEVLTRIFGWLFDQEHGLLPYAPIYLMAPAGWFALWRRNRELCIDISLMVGCYVAVIAIPFLNAHGWRGGWTPAARFLVPVAPFLAILVFASVAYLKRLPVIVMAIVVIQVCLDALFWNQPKLLWNDGVGTSVLLKLLDGNTGHLSQYVPSILPSLNPWNILLIAATSMAWLLLTLWLTRNLSIAMTRDAGTSGRPLELL
jgi:hypothetical protein